MKTDRISREEAWERLSDALRPISETMGEQFEKALGDYPELIIGLITDIGCSRFQIEKTRRQLIAGLDPDITKIDLPPITRNPQLDLFYELDPLTLKEKLLKVDLHIPEWELLKCEDLIEQYKEDLKCYENIPDDLPPGEYIEAVKKCKAQLEATLQQIVVGGCICDLLIEKLSEATACYEDARLNDIERCNEELDEVLRQIEENDCKY